MAVVSYWIWKCRQFVAKIAKTQSALIIFAVFAIFCGLCDELTAIDYQVIAAHQI